MRSIDIMNLGNMIALAANAHKDQRDKGGKPYILHPLAVMNLLPEIYRGDGELQQIAVGHDIIEDTNITYYDLRREGFSVRVCDAIWALTKTPGIKQEDYELKVLGNRDAIIVKMCDIRHNSDLTRLMGVSDKDMARLVKYAKFYKKLEVKV